jgi:hypothetical protein
MSKIKHFPHYLNARNDRKIRKGRLQLGIEFYAIYFMILEVLAEQKNFRYPLADIDILADDFGTSIQKIQLVITQYDLFEIDPVEQFFSPAQVKALQPYLEKVEHYKLMGKKSALARKLKAEQQIEELKKLSQVDSSKPAFNDGSTYAEQLTNITNKLTNKLNKSTLSINQLPEYFHSQETFVNYIRGTYHNQVIGVTKDKYSNKKMKISVSEKGYLYDKISGETFTGTRAIEVWSSLYELGLKGELPILKINKEVSSQ